MIAVIFAVAMAAPDCTRTTGALARDECELRESLAMDPEPDCGGTQSDMNICSYRDYLRADIELNRTWKALTNSTKGTDFARNLLEGQRAWLTYREKHCDVWRSRYEGGSMMPLVVNHCLTEITKFRTNELKRLLEDS